MNRKHKNAVKWLGSLLLQGVMGIGTGLLVAWLAFNYLKSNILSTVTDGVEILRIDDAITTLSDLAKYSPQPDGLAPVSQPTAMATEIQRARQSLERAGQSGEATLKELVGLLEAYEHLPVETTPTKFPGMDEVRPPKAAFRVKLQSFAARVNQITNTMSEIQGNIAAVELAATALERSSQQREDELHALALSWLDQIKRRVESAQIALEERKSTLIEALRKFAPN